MERTVSMLTVYVVKVVDTSYMTALNHPSNLKWNCQLHLLNYFKFSVLNHATRNIREHITTMYDQNLQTVGMKISNDNTNDVKQ